MRLLLDTHILLWLTLKPELLPAPLRQTLQMEAHELTVSAASAWELSIKFHIGKMPEAGALVRDFEGAVSALSAALLPITPAHAIRAGALEWAHRDPFDRLLVAQAQQDGLRLVSLDGHITAYPDAPLFRL